MNIMERINACRHQLRAASQALAEAEWALKQALAEYAAAHQLTVDERELLAQYVEAGGRLCCEGGRAWLRARLSDPWAQAINEWAYEHLSCDPREDERPRLAAKVRALKLDRLP